MKSNLKVILLLALTMLTFSCQDEPFDIEQDTKAENLEQEFTVLGKKNEIPFTVENMEKAYQNLLNNKTASKYPVGGANQRSNGYQVETTHYYVKFSPQTVYNMKLL